MQLVREVETSSARRAVRNFLLWRLGVWAFVGLVAVAGLAQHGHTSGGGTPSPPRDDALELTAEEIEQRVCLPRPTRVHAVRSEMRYRAPGSSKPRIRSLSLERSSRRSDDR